MEYLWRVSLQEQSLRLGWLATLSDNLEQA